MTDDQMSTMSNDRTPPSENGSRRTSDVAAFVSNGETIRSISANSTRLILAGPTGCKRKRRDSDLLPKDTGLLVKKDGKWVAVPETLENHQRLQAYVAEVLKPHPTCVYDKIYSVLYPNRPLADQHGVSSTGEKIDLFPC